MASRAYRHNGAIIIWWDETEDGDDTNHSIPEIIISPLAKGNAYASPAPVKHSSDLKSVEELFHLPAVNNPVPTNETDVTGSGYNNVAVVNDLSANATLFNAAGATAVLAPLGSPYVSVRSDDGDADGNDVLHPFESKTVVLEFLDPTAGAL